MSTSLLTALLAIAAVALVAVIARSSRPGEVTLPPREEETPDPPGDEADGVEDGFEDGEAAAISSDGLAFIGEDHAVRVVQFGEDAPQPTAMAPTVGERLSAGDFTAARVVRGAPGVDPWRLELLGRDGEFVLFPFETQDGAKTALALFESRGVVRAALDENGRPIPVPGEQFEEARRLHAETERELAMMHDEDPPKD